MRLSEENRDRAEWAAWHGLRDRLGMDFPEFKRTFEQWRFRGVYSGARCVGAVLDLNGYIHVSIMPNYRKRWANAKLLGESLKGAMVDGKVRSTIFRNDEFRSEFAKRLGFYRVKSGEVEEYEATHETIPY